MNKFNIYQERLYKEWLAYKKIIIATDYDSTISYWETIENHEDMGKHKVAKAILENKLKEYVDEKVQISSIR